MDGRSLVRTNKISCWHAHNHITQILKDLHWLPVHGRINFKLLLLTWKALNGLPASYISNPLVPYQPICTLRSSDEHLLAVPRTSTPGDHTFSVPAPTRWNSLPLDIRCCDSLQSFETLLKAHLYNKAWEPNSAATFCGHPHKQASAQGHNNNSDKINKA